MTKKSNSTQHHHESQGNFVRQNNQPVPNPKNNLTIKLKTGCLKSFR
ncbi:hypothetical protein HMPREF9371_2162 [Neisseria shayeganii 871]|uniref:Uncharacterized protein n=1 Tax=Neisseria shayeganii 871 TaxID=1032488 RepID=G4CKM2_9NEIS|nr:hypothetical protein HMPREF9371_2162 [Neisseria shayeganii 871]